MFGPKVWIKGCNTKSACTPQSCPSFDTAHLFVVDWKQFKTFWGSTTKNLRHIISQVVMGTDNRLHTRAMVKWLVSINASTGLIDGTTVNLSLSGAFIRLSKQLSYSDEMPSFKSQRAAHTLFCRSRLVRWERSFWLEKIPWHRSTLHTNDAAWPRISSPWDFESHLSEKSISINTASTGERKSQKTNLFDSTHPLF
jgi:hypothetical protein